MLAWASCSSVGRPTRTLARCCSRPFDARLAILDRLVAHEGEPEIALQGHGLRDHSWGPRYWQSTPSYRWITGNFGDGISIVSTATGHSILGNTISGNGGLAIDLSADSNIEGDGVTDDDLTVLRLAIQAGAWAGDEALARRALDRLREVNPQAVPAAERFLNDPPPRPAKAL